MTSITQHKRLFLPVVLLALMVAAAGLFVGYGSVFATHGDVNLGVSKFQIDNDANLKVDNGTDHAGEIDWVGTSDTKTPDLVSGSGDNSFGKGSKEDTEVPTVVAGSIPPNKSDLKTFGFFFEDTAGNDFIHVFWHRVQDPKGTTNMDFEFNQSSTLSTNDTTPVRTAGDLLIAYDLSKGGTNPVLSRYTWLTSGAASACESNSSLPCWGNKTNLTTAGLARGSINTSAIPDDVSDGLGDGSQLDPRTFGEATINLSAFGTGCVLIGSVYLKSRSSDSFTSSLKDFIAPTAVNINTCGSITIKKVTNPAGGPGFGYTDNIASPNFFSLADTQTMTFNNLSSGQYIVTEDDPNLLSPKWDLTDLQCDDGNSVESVPLRKATINLEAGETVECIFTNTKRGSIKIVKATKVGGNPAEDPQDFDFTSSTTASTPFTAAFTLDTDSVDTDHDSFELVSSLKPGVYTVTENGPNPADDTWHLMGIVCADSVLLADGGTNSSGVPATGVSTINLDPGEDVVCTYTNEQNLGFGTVSCDLVGTDALILSEYDLDGSGTDFVVKASVAPLGAGTTAIGALNVPNADLQAYLCGLVTETGSVDMVHEAVKVDIPKP